VRVSPIQSWHEANKAKPLIAGQWIRPEHYGDPQREVANTRANVGIIDVTPLGKYLLHGPDVIELLDLLYVNDFSSLKIGVAQYGLMCTDDGIVFDDGVTARLAEEEYLMTTTSSGAAAVGEWIESWLQGRERPWRVRLTPATEALASMNVAGPRSRELLGRVAEGIDLSPSAFPYMRARSARVAGVDGCHILRLGFTGELSYEIHVPAAYGLHVWEMLLKHGSDLGAAPFGIEAQRVMRLEKGHLIIGQDTDGLTNAANLGLGRFIKFAKSDFVGKPEIKWQSESNDGFRLVGVCPLDPSLVPPEASQIVDGNQSIGRVTSSRMSPTLKRAICLAVVPERLSRAGVSLTVRLPDGRDIVAQVTERRVHFDPEGVRLRG
jgi:sarcosine oxidase subunit alpha